MIGGRAKSAALVAVFELLLVLLSPDEQAAKPRKLQDSSGGCPGDSDDKRAAPAPPAAANDHSTKCGRTAADLSRPVLDFNNFVDLLVEFVRVSLTEGQAEIFIGGAWKLSVIGRPSAVRSATFCSTPGAREIS